MENQPSTSSTGSLRRSIRIKRRRDLRALMCPTNSPNEGETKNMKAKKRKAENDYVTLDLHSDSTEEDQDSSCDIYVESRANKAPRCEMPSTSISTTYFVPEVESKRTRRKLYTLREVADENASDSDSDHPRVPNRTSFKMTRHELINLQRAARLSKILLTTWNRDKQ